ncbi:unnamed protein product [Bathycoccus prasinos]
MSASNPMYLSVELVAKPRRVLHVPVHVLNVQGPCAELAGHVKVEPASEVHCIWRMDTITSFGQPIGIGPFIQKAEVSSKNVDSNGITPLEWTKR